jgi:hypothetical protein
MGNTSQGIQINNYDIYFMFLYALLNKKNSKKITKMKATTVFHQLFDEMSTLDMLQ